MICSAPHAGSVARLIQDFAEMYDSAATTRTERDSMGEMEVPLDILHGASTQRAVMNFPISGRPFRPP